VSREPRPKRAGFGPGDVRNGEARAMVAAVEAPVEPYPLRSGGTAVPDRSREPDVGAACHDTRKVSPPVKVDPDTNAGPSHGPVEDVRTRQEHGR
jgi:hypothetical protein